MLELAPSSPVMTSAGAENAAVAVTALPPRTCIRLQLQSKTPGDVASLQILGTTLSSMPGYCSGEDPLAWWLSPDSWLLFSRQYNGATLVASAHVACSGLCFSAIDVSDSLVGFEVSGKPVRSLLARGTGLDLSIDRFGLGRCTRVRFAQLPVLLRPLATDRFELFVDRGPSQWVYDWLIENAAGL